MILHADGSAEVRDDGRGIPVDKEPKTGLSGVEVIFTRLHAGGKFGGGSYVATGGLHGVGASVVNALSSRLDVEVDRAPSTWAMSFQRGAPGSFAGEGPEASFKAGSGLTKGARVKKGVTGTRIRFWPDRQIFTKDARFAYDELVTRARQTSFIVPGLEISIRDERGDEVVEESFKHDGGISEFCEFLASDERVTDVLRLQGVDHFVETVPVLDDAGHMTPQDVDRELTVDVAVRWGNGYDSELRSFVNVIATPKGGTHVNGFERSLDQVVQRGDPADPRLMKAGEPDVIKDDVLEGMTAVVTVRLAEPQFEGQTKDVLGTPAASRIVAKVVQREMSSFLSSNKKNEKPQAQSRDGEGRQRRPAPGSPPATSATPSGARTHWSRVLSRPSSPTAVATTSTAASCSSSRVTRRSAPRSSARDSEYQALLPIRGKILNTQKKSSGEMLQNAECSSIIQVVGAGSGRTFDIDQARYGKIIFMADADTDGAHIRCLLATLFHKHMRPLLEQGRIYSAVPPLHRIELSNPKKGMDKYVYTYTDDELQRKLAELSKKGVRWKDPVQRYKGLGEMDARQLSETTMDPRHRTLRRITIDDAESSEQVFELLMGNDVAPRKEFIVQGAYEVDAEAIDA